MQVLFIGFVWPEPRSSAAGQNILSYIQSCLAAGYHVHFCSAAETTPNSFDLNSEGVSCFSCKLNCESFNKQVQTINPDLVIFDRFMCFEQFAWRVKEQCPDALLVLDAEDLHFLRQARQMLHKQSTLHKFDSHCEHHNFMQSNDICNELTLLCGENSVFARELACIYQADITLLLSDFEANLLHSLFAIPQKQLFHHAFFIDSTSAYCFNSKHEHKPIRTFEQRQDFMFIGSYRHAPNVDSLKLLSEHLWPAIYDKLKHVEPKISCHVYGSYLSPKAKHYAKPKIGLHVYDQAPDQFEVISRAKVMLAPIPYGAGVKGKLLDAIMTGTPSVTSPIGAEGIPCETWPGAICENNKSFIDAAVALYTNQDSWSLAHSHAKLTLEDHIASSEHAKKGLLSVLQSTVQNIQTHRQHLFVQSILWNKLFLASKYMSQWIEAKNR
ncbi:glycosyltransferase [Glaciecola petra]|uniref:Glycosyltransferase n=1 Tax=Glaciecola petra TaxID=3075602 RepID=A0ABU2ZNI7_9ALTE|nr:glycosyltransferase [Aestuariibacter sp. P117]MDT0594175.1 glycosyltransferase [Aestuariibacter sp. P117]